MPDPAATEKVFNETDAKNLRPTDRSGDDKDSVPNELSLGKLKATPTQIQQMSLAVLIARSAPKEYSEPWLAYFSTICTQATQEMELTLSEAAALFQTIWTSECGQSVNVNRFNQEEWESIDGESKRQLRNLHSRGAQFGFIPPLDREETLPYHRPPDQSEEDAVLARLMVYQKMIKGKTIVILDLDQQIPVTPLFFIDKKDDLGLPRIDKDGKVVKRPITHLSERVCDVTGGFGGKNAQRGSPNDLMDSRIPGLDAVTLPSTTDVIVLRLKSASNHPGAVQLMAKSDLEDYFPAIKCDPKASPVMGHSLTVSVRAFQPWNNGTLLLGEGKVSEPLERTRIVPRRGELVIHLIALLLGGSFGAQLMPTNAQVPARVASQLPRQQRPSSAAFSGASPFNIVDFVDDFFQVESKVGIRCSEAKLCAHNAIYKVLGPNAISWKKEVDWSDTMVYIGKGHTSYGPGPWGLMMFAQHSKVIRLRHLLTHKALDPPSEGRFHPVPLNLLLKVMGLLPHVVDSCGPTKMCQRLVFPLCGQQFPNQTNARALSLIHI